MQFGYLLCVVGVDGLGAGEDVESEVSASFGPFVVLFGQDSAHEPDDAGAVGEDADDVGASADLAVESLVGVVGDLSPDLFGERGEGEDVGAGLLEVLGDGGEFAGEGVDDTVELGVYCLLVGLVIDRVQQRLDPAPGRLGRRT